MTAFTALLLTMSGAAHPVYVPPFDPRLLKGNVAGTPGELLVLGSPHLSGLPASFKPESLEPLLARLGGWRPAIITIVGASHKGYFEAYLNMMHDVRLVDAATLLK